MVHKTQCCPPHPAELSEADQAIGIYCESSVEECEIETPPFVTFPDTTEDESVEEESEKTEDEKLQSKSSAVVVGVSSKLAVNTANLIADFALLKNLLLAFGLLLLVVLFVIVVAVALVKGKGKFFVRSLFLFSSFFFLLRTLLPSDLIK